MPKSGYEKMRDGEIYVGPDWPLIEMQFAAKRGLDAYNATPAWEFEARAQLLGQLLGSFGKSFIQSPVTWEYGKHIHIGNAVFVNYDALLLDGADIRIGDGTVVGPRVQLITAAHPVEPKARTVFHPETGERIGGYCFNRPITIGEDCWIGAGSIIVGGVTIGDGTTIGAGSIVNKSLPGNVIAAGNPCRVIREIEDGEKLELAAEMLGSVGVGTYRRD